MMELLTDPQVWILLVTLAAIEIVLGIDNLVFISIAVGKLPIERREFARKFGIAVACITRVGLLLTLAWLARLTDPLFEVLGRGISVRDLILILGGLFLIVKGAMEIREQLKGEEHGDVSAAGAATASFGSVIAQIAVIDIVFSLDSVITAVGMALLTGVLVMGLGAGVGAAHQRQVGGVPPALRPGGRQVVRHGWRGQQLVRQAGQRRQLLAARFGAAGRHHGAGVPVQHGAGLAHRGDAGEAGLEAGVGGVHALLSSMRRSAKAANTATSDAARPYHVMA